MGHPLRAQLGKIAPTLSARERFLLVLRAHNVGETEDPSIRSTMPRAQVREFNRYGQLVFIANHTLWPILVVLQHHVEALEYQRERIARLDAAAALLEEQHPEEKAEAREREREPGMVTVPEYLRGLAQELRRDLGRELSLRWRELRALETVWAEIAAEFDGEPVTEHEVRTRVAETKGKLQELAAALAGDGGGNKLRRLPAPTAEFVDGLREVVRQSYERLGWLEPEPGPDGTAHRRARGRQPR